MTNARYDNRRQGANDHARTARAQESRSRSNSMPNCATAFARLRTEAAVKAVVLTGSGGNFCSGGDVHEIIGPLTTSTPAELLAFTQMTGDLVKAMRACPQPIVAAIDGTCAGAGAILAMAGDLRLGTERSRVAFLFVRVGLAGCDMGACAMLPRIVGLGRAAELLYTGRVMPGRQALRVGFLQRNLHARRAARPRARSCARARKRPHHGACHDEEDAAR